jgi:hypothetical protein
MEMALESSRRQAALEPECKWGTPNPLTFKQLSICRKAPTPNICLQRHRLQAQLAQSLHGSVCNGVFFIARGVFTLEISGDLGDT